MLNIGDSVGSIHAGQIALRHKGLVEQSRISMACDPDPVIRAAMAAYDANTAKAPLANKDLVLVGNDDCGNLICMAPYDGHTLHIVKFCE